MNHLKNNEEYDYIIVGAGAAGSVLAARLAEDPDVKVLLLESGPDNYNTSNLINKAVLSQYLYPRYTKYPGDPNPFVGPNDPLNKPPTEPDVGMCNNLLVSPSHSEISTLKENNSRYYAYLRGNGAGGSTNHHASIDGRGSLKVYDKIAELVNNPIWSSDNVKKYLKKMENYEIEFGNPELHGKDGWLNIRTSVGLNDDLTSTLIGAARDELNIPYRLDPAEDDQVNGIHQGMVQMQSNGDRSYAYKDLLVPIMNKNKNITVKFDTLVEKVNLIEKKKGKYIATSVTTYEKKGLQVYDTTSNQLNQDTCQATLPNKDLPNPIIYKAKKEIILSAGAINTPQLLMLSGLGPKEHLIEKGIRVLKDLPGVGSNLMDHLQVANIYELDSNKIMWRWQATYFKNMLNEKPFLKDQVPKEILDMIDKYYDPNTTNEHANLAVIDWFSDENADITDQADQHVIIPPFFVFDVNYNFFNFNPNVFPILPLPPGDNFHLEQVSKDSYMPNTQNLNNKEGIPLKKTELFLSQLNIYQPRVFLSPFIENMKITKTTGSIRLNDKDPRSDIKLNLNLWDDDDAVTRVAKMIMRLRKMMNNKELKYYAKDSGDYELYPGLNNDTIDKIKEYIKNWSSYGHHVSGTAAMGDKNDKNRVVTSKLKVRGVKNLRVVDASVYPTKLLHNYNISRGVYAIAEIAADIIKEKYC